MYYLILFLFSIEAFCSIEINQNKIEDMIDSNPSVINFQERLKSAEFLKGRLTRSFLPKISLNYGQERFTTGPYNGLTQPYGGIQAEVNLFNSGKDQLENAKREKEAQVALIDSQITKAHILAELRKALSHYAYLTELKSILKQALEQNENNLTGAQKRIQAGLATNTDSLDFQQQKIQLNQESSTLDYEIGVTQRLINILIGVNPGQETKIVFTNDHPDHSDESKIRFDGKSLLVQKVEINKDVAHIEAKQAKRWWTPSIDVYTYAMRFTEKEREYSPASERNDVTFGFNLTFPLFDGGEGHRFAQASKAIVEAQKAELRLKELELEKTNQDSVKKLELAHHLIHGAEENTQVMSEYRKGILREYGKGIKNSPDVLQASQRWIEAQIRYAEVKKNYQFARADALYLSELQYKK
jgi:outer membrane protein TolC